ncbi:MAG: putative glycosyltransferase [Chloroflexi bacterium]|nr:MAG: putative glycosyltransferase [Chloroflexota bacterium]
MATLTPFLSIIFPAHNEEQRLPDTLEQTRLFVETQPYPIEIIIIENASSDRTLEIAKEFSAINSYISVIHEDRPGKGLAVQIGMLAAQGKYRFICDVDLSMPIQEIPRFIPPQLEGVDIAIASREAKGAVRYGEPEYRHLIGRVFNNMVRWLTLPGLQDTQCGFKCFTAESAERLFPMQTIHGWTFDVEILAIAIQLGYRVVEVPIPWFYHAHSKIHVLKDSFRMALDLIKIRKIVRRKTYARSH